MGYVPIIPLQLQDEPSLRKRIRKRHSRLRSRRRDALIACRELIRRAEVSFGWRDDLRLRAPPKPTNDYQIFR